MNYSISSLKDFQRTATNIGRTIQIIIFVPNINSHEQKNSLRNRYRHHKYRRRWVSGGERKYFIFPAYRKVRALEQSIGRTEQDRHNDIRTRRAHVGIDPRQYKTNIEVYAQNGKT